MAHVFYTNMDNAQRLIIPKGDLETIECIWEVLVKEKATSQEISETCKKNVRDTISKMMSQHERDEEIRRSIQIELQNGFAKLGINPGKEIYNY